MEKLKVLSIDIGIINLGYVYAEITLPEFKESKCNHYTGFLENINIIDCNRVDITHTKHQLVKFCDCCLYHDNCVPDYLDHFIQELPHFKDMDILLLERQPPVGITNVQDLLFTKFRNKVLLISPNSVHFYFGMSDEYESRKKQSEKIANDYLCYFSNFNKNIRKHDISDALLMILFYYKLRNDNLPYKKCIIDFEKFRL